MKARHKQMVGRMAPMLRHQSEDCLKPALLFLILAARQRRAGRPKDLAAIPYIESTIEIKS
jgi:hypothetical protein